MFNYNTTNTNLVTLGISMSVSLLLIYLLTRFLNKDNENVKLVKSIVFYVLIYYTVSRIIIAGMEGSPVEIFQPHEEVSTFFAAYKTGVILTVLTCFSLFTGNGFLSLIRVALIVCFGPFGAPFLFSFVPFWMVESTLSVLPSSGSSSGSNSGTDSAEGTYTLEKRFDVDISNIYPAIKKGAEAAGVFGALLLIFGKGRMVKWVVPPIAMGEAIVEDRALTNKKMTITKTRYIEMIKEREERKNRNKELDAQKLHDENQAFSNQQTDQAVLVRDIRNQMSAMQIEIDRLKEVRRVEDNSDTLSALKVSGRPTGSPGSFENVPVTPMDTSSLPF